MSFFTQQIHFIAAFKRKLLVGCILGLFLSFIIIFLQPFDTNQFQSKNRYLLLSGFGFLLFAVFVLQSMMENTWYHRRNKVWLVIYEIVSTTLFFIFSGTVIYFYNSMVINGLNYSFKDYWNYLSSIVLVMIPLFAPLFLYLRQKFGEKIIPPSITSFVLSGENKNETLRLEKEEVLFVRAIENYVEILFVNQNKTIVSKTFRQTLANVWQQLPFLEKCHRSYLVNRSTIKEIKGNSQSAKISFLHGEQKIPLSKTYYKQLKSNL